VNEIISVMKSLVEQISRTAGEVQVAAEEISTGNGDLSQRTAEQASATGRRIELEPMSAAERRIVHEVLKDDPEVTTASEGTEPNRYVVVLPRRSAD